jgi:ABC-type dipeptide/oligopeptide/nickel transport system permease component
LGQYLSRRSLHGLVSLLGLVVLVFFLSRLTGDATNLYLPLDASLEARAEFAERNGIHRPHIPTSSAPRRPISLAKAGQLFSMAAVGML